MPPLFGIAILFISTGFSSNSRELPENNFTVGVFLDADDHISRKVLNLAVKNANRELDKSRCGLEIKIDILNENSNLNIRKQVCDQIQTGVVAIIDAVREVPSRHISSICSRFHIPHLVTSCRLPEFSESYPMDISLCPDCNIYANILFTYITQVEVWDEMIFFHSTDSSIFKYENLLNQFESRFKTWKWIHNDLHKNKVFLNKLAKSKIYRHFLVDIPYWQITDFLIMASVHNMTDPQNSFIFTDWDAHLGDISLFKVNNKVNITSFSIIGDPTAEQPQDNNKGFQNLLQDLISKENESQKKNKSRYAILFDSITQLARGLIYLKKTRPVFPVPMECSSNGTWVFGASLLNAMTSVDSSHGVTGELIFNGEPRRKQYNLTIMELTEDGFKKSGYWDGSRLVINPRTREPTGPISVNEVNPLRVTTIVNEPFVFYKYGTVDQSNYDTNIEAWDGFCIELLNEIGVDLQLNFTIHLVKDKTFGTAEENVTNADGSVKWNGMIGELISEEADLAVAPMTISYEREKVVDFTTPFMSLGLSVLFLRPQKEPPGLFSFLSPLSPPVWVYVMSAYIGVSLIIFFTSHITPYEYLQTPHCDLHSELENQFNLLNSLWFTTAAIMRQGLEFCPQASSTRMVSGAWWIFTLIIISTYTANLAAFLTVEQLILPIKSAEDLAKQTKIKYGTLKGGSSEEFFAKSLIQTYQKMYKFMKEHPDVLVESTSAGINKVRESNGKYAFLLESAMNDYYAQRDCNLIRVGDLLDSKGYGIGFPTGSPLRNKMTESILKLQKSQKLGALIHKWWTEMNVTKSCDIKEKVTYTAALNIYQVGGVFVLLGVAFVSAILVSIIELYVDYRSHKYPKQVSFHKYFVSELRFAMRFMSSSRRSVAIEPQSKEYSEMTRMSDYRLNPSNESLARIIENKQSSCQSNQMPSQLARPPCHLLEFV